VNKTTKKQTRKNGEGQIYRGSEYRGVSINGGKWQVFFIVKNKKFYVGQVSSEYDAARLYDKLSIMHNGSEGKSNFSYNSIEVQTILKCFSEPESE
jgi:predicted Mrr-cat superfamily restriction endonuclease